MAIGVLILGESGTGKTHSAKTFSPDEVKILSVKKPILPFRGKYELVKTPTGDDIIRELKNTDKKRIVIDDFQYILGVQMMKRVGEKGWDKFNEIQQPYADVLETIDTLPDDVIVYFNSHVERDDEGKKKIKTIGKALDKYLTVEGLFMIVLGTMVVDGKYYFTTQNSGNDTIKSPEGMFPSYAISNDLKYVDDKIRNYYEIGDYKSDEEMAAKDEEVKTEETGEKKKRTRRSEKEEKSAEAPEEEEKEEKPKRRSRSTTDTTIDSERGTSSSVSEDGSGDSDTEKPKRSRRREEGLKIANAGVDESGETESVPFSEVEVPKRRRRVKAEETPTEEATEEAPEAAAPVRRRRRA